MLEYTVNQTNNDLIITILEGTYKSVVAKVVDLKMDDGGQLTFEMELPTTKTELFNDNTFIDEIQNIVGDITKKSIDYLWSAQEEILTINEKMVEMLKEKKVSPSTEQTELEKCMSKGILLKLDDTKEKIMAIDMKENKEYDLTNDGDFEYIRRKVYSNIELN